MGMLFDGDVVPQPPKDGNTPKPTAKPTEKKKPFDFNKLPVK